MFNSSSFHAAPYRNLVCSWNTSWYAKYVLMVDWRNKWAGCKVDKNVGKWNKEQYSNPRWMSLQICICPDSDTNTSETGNFTCVSTDIYSITQSLIKQFFLPVDFVTCLEGSVPNVVKSFSKTIASLWLVKSHTVEHVKETVCQRRHERSRETRETEKQRNKRWGGEPGALSCFKTGII